MESGHRYFDLTKNQALDQPRNRILLHLRLSQEAPDNEGGCFLNSSPLYFHLGIRIMLLTVINFSRTYIMSILLWPLTIVAIFAL